MTYSQYQDLSGYQGVPEEEEQIPEYLREDYDATKTQPVEVTRNKDGEPEMAPPSAPKNAQETLGKTPTQPEQSQEEKDKDYQASLITEAADWAAEKLLGRSREESEAQRDQGRQRNEAIQQDIDRIDESNSIGYTDKEGNYQPVIATTSKGIARDTVRAVTSGVEKAGQDAIGFANFAGDFVKTRMGLVDPDDEWNNTDHANYRGSERDLVMAQPRSQAGLVARDLVSFVVMQRQLGGATGLNKLTAGKGLINPQRLAADTALGALADFIMDPGDGNASNALIEVFPSLENNPLIAAFAQADDDDEFTRRLKNTIEGGVMGIAVDAAGVGLKGLFNGAKYLIDWVKKNPGKKAIDAPVEVKEAAYKAFYDQLELDLPSEITSTKPPKTLEAHEAFTEISEGDFSRVDQLNAEELRSVVQDYEVTRFISEKDLLKAADPEVSMEAVGEAITTKKLPNGSEIDWIQTKIDPAEEADEVNEYGDLIGQNVVRIDWDIQTATTRLDAQSPELQKLVKDDYTRQRTEGEPTWDELNDAQKDDWAEGMRKEGFGLKEENIGSHGTKLYRQFGEVAKDLKPGTIVQAQAAEDGFGAKGISSAQERRASITTRNKASKAWIKENNDALKEQYLKDIGQTEPEYWDNLDMQAKWDHFEGRGIEGVVPEFVDPKKNELSIREKLYQRAGLSEPNPDGDMFGIVRYRPNGRKVLQPVDFTRPIQEQVDEAIESARQYELNIDWDSAEVRPGKFDRYVEDYENGGNRFRQDYEPYERGSRTTEYPMEKVLAEQAQDANRASFTPSAPSPRLTDNTVRQLTRAGADMDIINRAVKELEEKISPRLRANDPAVVKEAQDQLTKLIKNNLGEDVDLSALTDIKGEGGDAAAYIQQLLGNVVAKSFLKDLSIQMRDFAAEAKEIASTGADANRQYNLMLDRLSATAALQMRDASRRGGALKTLQNNIFGSSADASRAKIEDFQEKVEKLRTKLNQGDPEAAEELNVIAESMVLADGDADLAMSFGAKWAKMVKEDFTVTLYNSYLSGINTQGRNILGNMSNVILKPLQIAMGAHQVGQRRSALAMYGSLFADMYEGLQVTRTAFMDKTTPRRLEGTWQGMDMAKKLENLRASAKNPVQNALYIAKAAQYYMMANPWLQGATRLLSATDDGFKVLSARQRARFDAHMLAIQDGIKFDPDKFETVWSTKYKNGQVEDPTLLAWAQQDTFQEELTGNMAFLAEKVNDSYLLKYIIPFVRTPTNIIKQTGHYIPFGGAVVKGVNDVTDVFGLGRNFLKEYDAVMRGSDPVMKAVYKGREATGTIMFVTGVTMGMNGLITGQGPRDPDKLKAWEEAGNQRHSIKLGGVWVSTRFLGPIGILLSAYADLGMVAATAGAYDNYQDMSMQLIYSTAGALLDQSWLKGMVDSFTAMSEVAMGRREGNWKDSVAMISKTMVPYQAALRAVNNTLKPAVQDYNNSMDKFWAETVPGGKYFFGHERISLRTGEPVYNQGMSALNQFVPFGLKEVQEDPLLNKLVDHGIDFSMEMYDKYRGEQLSAEDLHNLNKYFAQSGVWEDLEGIVMTDSFDETFKEWQSEHKGRPRKDAEWYKEITGRLSKARDWAINEYRRNGKPDGNAFDERIEAIDLQKHLDNTGQYGAAALHQEVIELANP